MPGQDLPGKTVTPRNRTSRPLGPPVDTDDPPAPPPAATPEDFQLQPPTSATAGTPGTWDPNDGAIPRIVGEMSGITPIPDTPWTEGQGMRMSSGNYTFWNGTAWRSGRAPAPAE